MYQILWVFRVHFLIHRQVSFENSIQSHDELIIFELRKNRYVPVFKDCNNNNGMFEPFFLPLMGTDRTIIDKQHCLVCTRSNSKQDYVYSIHSFATDPFQCTQGDRY